MSKVFDKVLALLVAVSGMVALPVGCFALRNSGPAARVVFFDYFPIHHVAMFAFAALLGALLGTDAVRALHARATRSGRRTRWLRLKLAALVVVIAWAVTPQVYAFPAHGSVAERDAWAREHVREYPSLARVVAACPDVQRDLGRITAIAPTAYDVHRFAREMNGDDMHFTFEVIGEKGEGTFFADCTLDGYTVYEWRKGLWTFRGHRTRIDKVSLRVPR